MHFITKVVISQYNYVIFLKNDYIETLNEDNKMHRDYGCGLGVS